MTIPYPYVIILTNKNGLIVDCNHVSNTFFSRNVKVGENILTYLKQEAIKNSLIFFTAGTIYDIYVIKNIIDSNFLEYILEHAYDEIFVTDNKGIVIYCNKTFEKNYGIKRKVILGKDVNLLQELGIIDQTLVHQVIDTKTIVTYKQHTNTGKTILTTFKPIFDSNGEVLYIVENCRDISKMTQLEESLKEKDIEIKDYAKKLKYFNTIDKQVFLDFKSESMIALSSVVNKLSIRNVNILLLGESGTGKSHLANHIHDISLRSKKPFVTINCTTIPEKLMESELFGHEKGSFTGANEKKEGLVEQANTGTLFLDEIAELPLPMQAKLLQLIQEKTYTPVGSVIPKKVDIRIIAATNQNLKKLMLSGEFREDLYYRLALGVIEIPPLRERKTDALNLINYYLGVFNKKYESNVSLSTESLYILKQYSWPGNIRELEHVIEFLIVNANYPQEEIGKNSLPNNMIEEVKIPVNFENFK